MRKSEYLKLQESFNDGGGGILIKDHMPLIKEMWFKYGYEPNYLLDENDDFYNLLLDFRKDKDRLAVESQFFSHAYEEDAFQAAEDAKVYKKLYDIAKNHLCGFYNVKKRRYFNPGEINPYAEWYLDSTRRTRDYPRELYEEYFSKYSAMLENIAALLIAQDVSDYLDGEKMRNASITKNNVGMFLKKGPYAGMIFDPVSMEYRKPIDFEEYAHYIHTDYWFHDPKKGYKPDARYKWDSSVPMPNEMNT